VVGRGYDWAFLLLPPLLALGLGVAISGTPLTEAPLRLLGREQTAAGLLVGTLIHAHLVAVFLRSHGNGEVRRLHPVRFFLVPLLAWGAIRGSPVVAVAATVLATFWDVWHSGLQTFGLARIYARNAGHPPDALRRWDLWLNALLYLGPVLAGATLAEHLHAFEAFGDVGLPWLATVPARASAVHRALAWALLGGGGLFLAAYLAAHVRHARAGHRTSLHKTFLLVTTGACSVYTWGFDSWGEAFFIMNLFHAVQYLALVWALEGRRLREAVRLGHGRAGRAAGLALFLGACLAYGAWAELLDPDVEGLWALTLVVSLMHFWYDGFIWSVRRRQV
jgi:hypothetical protein